MLQNSLKLMNNEPNTDVLPQSSMETHYTSWPTIHQPTILLDSLKITSPGPSYDFYSKKPHNQQVYRRDQDNLCPSLAYFPFRLFITGKYLCSILTCDILSAQLPIIQFSIEKMQMKPLLILILSAVLCLQIVQTAIVTDPLATFRTVELNIHNAKRALHGCPQIKLNDTLNAAAQAYAQKLANSHTFVHSSNRAYGENLYWAWGSPSLTYTNGSASNSWYSQISNYNFTTGMAKNTSKPIGHFTAMIWKSVSQVGFGFARIAEKGGFAAYVVANYAPAPNVGGQYLANVPKLK